MFPNLQAINLLEMSGIEGQDDTETGNCQSVLEAMDNQQIDAAIKGGTLVSLLRKK